MWAGFSPAGEAVSPEDATMKEDDEAMRKPRMGKVPRAPTSAEVEEHEVGGHCVYRSWCPPCVRARALSDRHVVQETSESADPTIAFDYGYMGADNEKTMPILVAKDGRSKTIWATALDKKGENVFAVECFLGWIRDTGYFRFELKSDEEPSLLKLKSIIIDRLKQEHYEVFPKESPVGDHQANGLAEVAVRELKICVRAIKFALEERIGRELEGTHPLLAWIPRHASMLMSRYRIAKEGKTAYELMFGKPWNRKLLQYGERAYFKPVNRRDFENLESKPKGRHANDFQSRFQEGHYVGTNPRTGELLMMTDRGVIRGTSYQRMTDERRFKVEDFANLKGVPWELKPEGPSQEQQKKFFAEETTMPPGIEIPPAPLKVMPGVTPRRMSIRKEEVDQFDPTKGCTACAQLKEGRIQHARHTERCRARFEELMGQTDAGREKMMRVSVRQVEADRDAGSTAPDQKTEAKNAGGSASSSQVRQGGAQDSGSTDPSASTSTSTGRMQTEEPKERPESEDRQAKRVRTDAGSTALPEQQQRLERKRRAENQADGLRLEPDKDADGDIAIGSLSKCKQRDVSKFSSKIKEAYQNKRVPITEGEADSVALMLSQLGYSNVDVAEIFSPPRFTARAADYNLVAGLCVDLSTLKPDGEPWDLRKPEDEKLLEQLQEEQAPRLATGGPPCTTYSALRRLSDHKRDPKVVAQERAEGKAMLQAACRAYRRQYDGGRYFLHEHPKGCDSWKEECIQELMALPGVKKVSGPMCRWEMKAEDANGVGYVRKETEWLTNCPELAKVLEGVCSNNEGRTWHRHVHLVGGRAAAAAEYPPKLVAAVLKALRKQLIADGHFEVWLAALAGPVPEEKSAAEDSSLEYWDDVNGGILDPVLTAKARQEELDWVEKGKVMDIVPMKECWDETGRGPETLKWIDTNKGDSEHPRVRSRIVVREHKGRTQLDAIARFSSMPPLEALKFLCSLFMTLRVSKRNKPLRIGVYDISRAHFYATSDRKVYVTLPEEWAVLNPGCVGKLNKTMYGRQDASNRWQADYTELLQEHSWNVGVSNKAVFFSKEEDGRCMVHGDDFVVLGDDETQAKFEAMLKTKYDVKRVGYLGDAFECDKEIVVLNRVLRVTKNEGEEVLEYEPDQRHAELIVEELGLTAGNTAATPREKKTHKDLPMLLGSPALKGQQVTQFRSLVMRAAFLSQDRADISEATKCLARRMKEPRECDWQDLKRLGRYLARVPRIVTEFKTQKIPKKLVVTVDSDHAGCVETSRSTTGMVASFGRHTVKHASNIQSTIGLSSGESEYYAIVKGVAVAFQLQALVADFGITTDVDLPIEVQTDSSAAKGTGERQGLGKLKHVRTRYLWVQERVAQRDVGLVKIGTKSNFSDMLTKALTRPEIDRFMKVIGQVSKEGRASKAKKLIR